MPEVDKAWTVFMAVAGISGMISVGTKIPWDGSEYEEAGFAIGDALGRRCTWDRSVGNDPVCGYGVGSGTWLVLKKVFDRIERRHQR